MSHIGSCGEEVDIMHGSQVNQTPFLGRGPAFIYTVSNGYDILKPYFMVYVLLSI